MNRLLEAGVVGDLPTWLATAGAFVAVRLAWRALQVEHARDQDRRQSELSAQASRIAAWLTDELILREAKNRGNNEVWGLMFGSHWVGGVRVRNTSDVPVYGAELIVYNGAPREVGRWPLGTLPPGERNITYRKLIADGSVNFAELFPALESDESKVDWDQVLIGISFYDASSHQWERDYAGQLVHKGFVGFPPPVNTRPQGAKQWIREVRFQLEAGPWRDVLRRKLRRRHFIDDRPVGADVGAERGDETAEEHRGC